MSGIERLNLPFFTVVLCFAANASLAQKTSNGFHHPPVEFTKVISSSLAEEFSNEESCYMDWYSSSVTWRSEGKWEIYTVSETTLLYKRKASTDEAYASYQIPFGVKLAVKDVSDGKESKNERARLQVEFYDNEKETTLVGWVDACEVLLWTGSIARNGGFPERRVTLSQFKQSSTNNGINDALKFYQSANSRSRSSGLVPGLEILYKLKEKELRGQTWLLLVKSSNSKELENDLRGWLPENQTTPWDTRVAYWENHSRKGQIAYEDREIPLFSTLPYLNDFINSEPTYDSDSSLTNKGVIPVPVILNAESPRLNRMLHLEASDAVDAESERRELMTIVNASEGSHLTEGDLNAKMSEYEKKVKNLNIHFVIDATASMDKNAKAIRSGVESFMKTLQTGALRTLLNEVTLTYGCSVYRGVEDGDDVYDYAVPFSEIKDADDSDAFLQEIDSINFQSASNDRTLEEGLYYGIMKSLDHDHFKPSNSNYLIVIGDAGDDGKEVNTELFDRKDVLKELQEKEVDVLFLQSTNGSSAPYDSFIRDAFFFIDGLYDGDGAVLVEHDSSYEDWMKVSTEQPSDTNTNVSYYGAFFVNTNSQIALKDSIIGVLLSEEIEKATSRTYKRHKELISRMNYGGLTEDDWKKMGVEPADIPSGIRSLRAYGNLTYYGDSVPAFIPYVFMEHDVFEEFKEELRKLARKNTQQYYSALELFFKQYAAQILGLDDYDSPLIQEMTMASVWLEAFNVPFAYEHLGKVRIDEIAELQNTNDDEPNEAVADLKEFKVACDGVQDIDIVEYKFNMSFVDNENSGLVYWIPGYLFPGMNP